MKQSELSVYMDERTRKHTLIAGGLMGILGTLGVLLPQVMSLTVSLLLGWLLILSGVVVAYQAWHNYSRNWQNGFKPVLLLLSGLLIIFNPTAGAAALGLLLAAILMLDSYANLALAFTLKPLPGWGWMLFNAIVTLALSILIIVGWPSSSLIVIGVIVGFSLLFDGLTLLMLGWKARKV